MLGKGYVKVLGNTFCMMILQQSPACLTAKSVELTYTFQHLVTLIQYKVSHSSKFEVLLLDQLHNKQSNVSNILKIAL